MGFGISSCNTQRDVALAARVRCATRQRDGIRGFVCLVLRGMNGFRSAGGGAAGGRCQRRSLPSGADSASSSVAR